MKKKSGFTLLELLVVILIIGILAAVALPEYQLAVDKAQFANMRLMVSTVRKAYHHYLLIYDTGPTSFNDLDLDFLQGTTEYKPMHFFKCVDLPDMHICMSGGGPDYSGNVRAFSKDLSFEYGEKLLSSTDLKIIFVRTCYASENSIRGNRLCKNVGFNRTGPGDFSTPLGKYEKYYQYSMN